MGDLSTLSPWAQFGPSVLYGWEGINAFMRHVGFDISIGFKVKTRLVVSSDGGGARLHFLLFSYGVHEVWTAVRPGDNTIILLSD